ncbi:C1 family peptidase, partial [Arachidicoccus sp.]|uniref:C1 family peptidase n=1 Tax=Arachidicoccus sp. TaxID=1872624 RepID=UPI003D202FC2
DCRTDGDYGCAPGCPSCALESIRKNGVATLSDYPYVSGSGQAGSCQAQSNGAVFISSWTDEGADESQLTTALYNNGPLVYG